MNEKNITIFADMIKKSRSTVFFGGAGVSTESGVKDYRSEDGLYNTVKEYGVSPETILSHSFFVKNPDVFYDFYFKYFLESDPKPNKAHIALAQLEERGMLSAVITQNIDSLHQKAGSKNVIELHGTAARHYCPGCMTEYPLNEIKAFKGKIPICQKCGKVIKPAVTLYEEALDESTVEQAIRAISKAELLIIGGTSLAVYPAALYVKYFSGENIVFINKSETPYDSRANLIFRDSIGEVLSRVTEMALE